MSAVDLRIARTELTVPADTTEGHCHVNWVGGDVDPGAALLLRSRAAPEASLLAPDPARVGPGYPVVAGHPSMATWAEEAVDRPVRGQELLSVPGRLEPLHLAFLAPGWAM